MSSTIDTELLALDIQNSIDLRTQNEEITTLNNDILAINQKLEQFQINADRLDYAFSVASGLLCGVIDSLFVGELSVTKKDIGLAHEKANRLIEGYAKKHGYEDKGKGLKGAVEFLEKKYPVAQDNVWSGKNLGISAKNHHLADMAHHPTVAGLLSAIAVQFFRTGVFVDKDGAWHLIPVKTEKKDILENWIPLVISGVILWLINLSENAEREKDNSEIPEYVWKLARLLATAPAAVQVLKCVDNWIGHLMSDLAGSKQTAGKGMGIPGVFLSFMYEIAALPLVNQSGLTKHLDSLYEKQKLNLRKEIPIYEHLAKQTIPVVLNEILVRTFYCIRHLVEEIKEHDRLQDVDWKVIVPVNNRTIDRMITVANLTFSAADTADAAIRAAVESGGNWVLFAGNCAVRINYVGLAKSAFAVVKEVSYEQKELQLMREKRILVEAKTDKAVEIIQRYRAAIEAEFNQYMAEDLEQIVLGFNNMEYALTSGDSDRFISGNVVIQRVLGKEVQFTNQNEFDALMESDDDFKL